jgi:hypothetical protein
MTDPVVKRIPPNFYELVKKWYGFLESQYGFRLSFENSAQPGPAADGMVVRHRFHGRRDRQRAGRRFRLVLPGPGWEAILPDPGRDR